MRLAMIGQKGLPARLGGVEKHVFELATGLARSGHTVIVYGRTWYTKKSADTVLNGIHLIHQPTIATKHLDTITHTFFATLHAMRHDADVIHYHGVGPALLAWLPRVFTPSKRVVVTFHCIDRKHAKWGRFARTVLRLGEWAAVHFAHTTIAVSTTIQQYIRDVYDRSVPMIPSCVTMGQSTATTAALANYGLEAKNYVLAVSRLIPHKGIHDLIMAWQILKTNNPAAIGATKLVIVGDGHHTDAYVRQLHSLAQPDDQIIFTGGQTGQTLAEFFCHARFFVHPSWNEGLPLAVLEAMSYGLPILVSSILEHQHLIADPACHFPAQNPLALAKSLRTFLTFDEKTLEQYGAKHRGRIAAEFSWQKIGPQILACYQADYRLNTAISLTPSPSISTAATSAPGRPVA